MHFIVQNFPWLSFMTIILFSSSITIIKNSSQFLMVSNTKTISYIVVLHLLPRLRDRVGVCFTFFSPAAEEDDKYRTRHPSDWYYKLSLGCWIDVSAYK